MTKRFAGWIEGVLGGIAESFNIVHAVSTAGDDAYSRRFMIVPSSGTGGLASITGTGEVVVVGDDVHSMTLDYTL